MKDKFLRMVDRVIRTTALALCVLLLNAIVVMWMVPLVELILVHAGVGRLDAVVTALQTPFVTVPAVLVGNIVLFVRSYRVGTAGSRTGERTPGSPVNAVLAIG